MQRKVIKWVTVILSFVMGMAFSWSCQKRGDAIRKAETIVFSNPDSALLLLKDIEAGDVSGAENRAKYALLLTIANDRSGIAHESPDDILSALDYYAEHDSPDSLLGIASFYLGRVYEGMEQPEMALESYLKAKPYFTTATGDYWQGMLSFRIGYLYYRDKDYSRAALSLDEAVRHFSRSNDSLNLAHTYGFVGTNYLLQGEYAEALNTLEQANNLHIELGDTEGIMNNVLTISNIYLEELNDVLSAESILLKTYRRYNDGEIPLNHYPFVSQIEAKKENFAAAIDYLRKYIRLNPGLEIEKRSALLYMISDYYHELGRHSTAYDHLNDYIYLMDTVNQNRMDVILQEVEKKHAKQELENEYESYRRQTAYQIVLGAFGISVVLGLMISEARKRRKKNQDLQADIDGLRSQMGDFADLEDKLSVMLDMQVEKETRLQEVLTNKMLHIQKLVDYLFLYENNPDEFKKKIRIAVVQAKKDEYFGELHEIVNDRYYGIVDHLKRLHPSLSNDELSLCCLICFGFNNNQIGILFGYTNANSIFNKRHKIRKKMGLWPNYESLEAYLTQVISDLSNNEQSV